MTMENIETEETLKHCIQPKTIQSSLYSFLRINETNAFGSSLEIIRFN